ncbi:MAG: radical SAM protein [Sphingomonadaceae bacterium]
MTIITHGCRSNLAERDALASLAAAGTTVINSCAVTAAAVADARTAAVRALKSGPVVVTGCAATVVPERFAGLDLRLLPNADKLRPHAWGRNGHAPRVATRQSRGFVAVQDGCDHDCTFCVTRLARGASRSIPIAEVVAAVRGLGANEVVLTGIDTSSWGQDLPGQPTLGALVQAILTQVPELPRLRLSSLDAAAHDPALIEAFSDPRLMPHVHLSLQSGDDLILKRMKRRHSRADAEKLVARLKAVRPEIAIGCDLIAGFPTESEEAHRQSLSLLESCDIVHAHIFPYSPRPGTAAARMPQQGPGIAKRRAAELRARSEERHRGFLLGHVGRSVETISEGARGLTPGYATVRYAEPQPKGKLVRVVPGECRDGVLLV